MAFSGEFRPAVAFHCRGGFGVNPVFTIMADFEQPPPTTPLRALGPTILY